jgi:hypothetical protein
MELFDKFSPLHCSHGRLLWWSHEKLSRTSSCTTEDTTERRRGRSYVRDSLWKICSQRSCIQINPMTHLKHFRWETALGRMPAKIIRRWAGQMAWSGTHAPTFIKTASNAEWVFRGTKTLIACVDKLEKWSLRRENIGEILQRFHTEGNTGNMVNKLQWRRTPRRNRSKKARK